MKNRAIRSVAALLVLLLATAVPSGQQAINLQDTMPFDAAVRTATLPNGLKYFVRQNSRPAGRVALRLAVKAGSLHEADDQLGLAHLIEHMAFNGSAHFKPGELVSYFESIGARLGPHVNAYTSFDETVYMFDVPTDKKEVVAKALTALADFAGGLSLTPQEIDKERGVVIEEWRGGLGAGSRIRDKQFPVLFHQSRYAERLPIGKPEILRNAPAARLRAFYDTWYRPELMAVDRRRRFRPGGDGAGDQDAFVAGHAIGRRRRRARSQGAAAPAAARQRRRRPGGDAVERLDRAQAAAREAISASPTTGAIWSSGSFDHMMNERFGELARKPDAKFLGAGVGGGALSRDVSHLLDERARSRTASSRTASACSPIEALRVREFGFSASELDRAKQWMAAFYERAYNERDKTESGSFAQEYVNYFLEDEPSPGIEYEYRLVQQLLPAITDADVVDDGAVAARRRQPRDPGHLAAEDRRQGADRSRSPGGAGRGDRRRASRRGPTPRRRGR